MQPKDQQDRLTAALPSASNIIVEAGAGTGKTTLLTDRLCYLILGKDIPIDKIIALTFTEKAAAEIKIRLLAKMQRIITSLDKTENREPAADILNKLRKDKGRVAEGCAIFFRTCRARADKHNTQFLFADIAQIPFGSRPCAKVSGRRRRICTNHI